MGALPRRTFPRAGLTASAMGLGTAPLGDLFARLDERAAVGAVVSALESGVNLIDTSPLYGHGLAELRVGAALRQYSGPRPIISTKVGRVMQPFAVTGERSGYVGGVPHSLRFDYSADGALRSLEQSMLRLGVDHIDIALIHDVDVWTHGAVMIDQRLKEALSGAYLALERLRREGIVKSIGIGVNEADIAARFVRETDIDALMLAGRYSLLEQPALDDFLPLAEEKGVAVMLGGVFNSGILATGAVEGAKYNYRPAPAHIMERVGAIEAVCKRHKVPLRVAALHFALAHPAVVSVVLGAVTPDEVASNLAAMTGDVPTGLWAELKAEGLLNPAAPTP